MPSSSCARSVCGLLWSAHSLLRLEEYLFKGYQAPSGWGSIPYSMGACHQLAYSIPPHPIHCQATRMSEALTNASVGRWLTCSVLSHLSVTLCPFIQSGREAAFHVSGTVQATVTLTS